MRKRIALSLIFLTIHLSACTPPPKREGTLVGVWRKGDGIDALNKLLGTAPTPKCNPGETSASLVQRYVSQKWEVVELTESKLVANFLGSHIGKVTSMQKLVAGRCPEKSSEESTISATGKKID